MKKRLLALLSALTLMLATAVPALAQPPFSTPPQEEDVCPFVAIQGETPIQSDCSVDPS